MCLSNDAGVAKKYKEVYLHAYETVKKANDQIGARSGLLSLTDGHLTLCSRSIIKDGALSKGCGPVL